MFTKLAAFVLFAAMLSLTACYHVTTRTGRPASGQVVEKKAHMFVLGLVGYESNAPCAPAVIETQQGVVDWLIGGLTLGLYTPYTLTVTCASDAPPIANVSSQGSTPSIRW
jgi:hypothetical protein